MDSKAQPRIIEDSIQPETDTQKLYDTYFCSHAKGFLRRHRTLLLVCAAPSILYSIAYAYFWVEQEYSDYIHPIRAAEAQKEIGSIRLTRADADGSSLPPLPDTALNGSTVAGIDANSNYIRDDVELEMFALYPIDMQLAADGTLTDLNLKKRAAALQYAQAMQVFLTKVDSEYTMRAALHAEDYTWDCLGEDWEAISAKLDSLLIFNTEIRKTARGNIDKEFMTSYGVPITEEVCHIR
jgi:hypothetical protein